MGITIESGLLQAPCPAALIYSHHAVRLRMQEAGLDGPRVGTVSEEGHGAFKITKDG
jgi:hypothetical protein